jgi:hypothetical protein
VQQARAKAIQHPDVVEIKRQGSIAQQQQQHMSMGSMPQRPMMNMGSGGSPMLSLGSAGLGPISLDGCDTMVW